VRSHAGGDEKQNLITLCGECHAHPFKRLATAAAGSFVRSGLEIDLSFGDNGIFYLHRRSKRRTAKMARAYKLVVSLSWWLGVVCLTLGVLMKLARPSGVHVFGTVTAHSLLFFAETLFLCTLATWVIESRDAAKPKV